jgi:polyhydroxybutyrate depolymerase
MEVRRSAGCGVAPPGAPLTRLVVEGRERSIITHVLGDYAPGTARPLIVAFHGRTNSNAQVRRYYDLEAYAPDAIIVYPAALRQGRTFSWSVADDYPFFDAILDEVPGRYCVDLDRVFVVGHSLGAWFANGLACARGDRVRAVASLGGGVDASACAGEVAAMVLHNPRDRLVSVRQGGAARDLFLSVSSLSGSAQAFGPPEFKCVRYGALEELNPVVWCPHEQDYAHWRYYPHSWPEDTARVIVDFLSPFPRPGEPYSTPFSPGSG